MQVAVDCVPGNLLPNLNPYKGVCKHHLLDLSKCYFSAKNGASLLSTGNFCGVAGALSVPWFCDITFCDFCTDVTTDCDALQGLF